MIKQKKGILSIPTSNIVVPGNKQSFPEAFQHTSRLHYYGSLFNTLEVNSTFYKLPKAATFENWSLDVPKNFRFSLKLSRQITHVKDLAANPGDINLFLKAAGRIGDKKGCLLIQFPGKITMRYFNQVEEILQRLTETDLPEKWKKAIEFRSPTWYQGETYELLDQFGASIVLHDIPKAKNFDPGKKASFVYIRFHGPKGDYRGSYSDDFLNEKAELMTGWVNEGKDVYAYFNNTIGNAFENAMSLKALTQK